jgi:hypothetical protein
VCTGLSPDPAAPRLASYPLSLPGLFGVFVLVVLGFELRASHLRQALSFFGVSYFSEFGGHNPPATTPGIPGIIDVL